MDCQLQEQHRTPLVELLASAPMQSPLPTISQQTAELLIQSYVIGRRNKWSVLKASGSSIRDYLQGQITHDMAKLKDNQGIYACVLTPQGKAVSELYMIEGHGEELILITPQNLAVDAVARLRQFVLGADLRIGLVENMAVCSLQGANAAKGLSFFDLEEPGQSRLSFCQHASKDISAMVISGDPRGFWIIASKDDIETALVNASSVTDESEFEAMRIIQGLPRFGVDWTAETYPLNANLIEFDGVSFEKGCYVGQEITSRMHWRGGIKKKLYKVMVQSNSEELTSLPCPLRISNSADAAKIGELTSAAIDHEGAIYGIALLPVEITETSRPLFMTDNVQVDIVEPCHA